MVREVNNVRPFKREHRRRWLQDDELDLIVWGEDHGSIHGIRLSYQQYSSFGRKPSAVTWSKDQGYSPDKIDEGGLKTPILISDGPLPRQRDISEFLPRSADLPAEIVNFVHQRLIACP